MKKVKKSEKSENGKIFLFISEESARTITSFMLNKSFDFGEIGEIEESLITETANIVASTLITPVGNFLGRKIDISPPNLTVDVASAAVGSILAQQLAKTGHYFFVQTEVIASDISFSMELLLFPYFDLVKEVWKKMNI
jgi:Chemotaxis protein CheC, inhibitor of MCP methylation